MLDKINTCRTLSDRELVGAVRYSTVFVPLPLKDIIFLLGTGDSAQEVYH